MNGKRPPPSPSSKEVKKSVGGKEYTAKFYPGFASNILVNGVSIYDQRVDGPNPFVLPEPDTKPWKKSDIVITRGTSTVTVTLDDPDHIVDQVQVTLKDGSTVGGAAVGAGAGGVTAFQSGGDTIVINNTAQICPPAC